MKVEEFSTWCQANGYGDAVEFLPHHATTKQIELACDRLDESVAAFKTALAEQMGRNENGSVLH